MAAPVASTRSAETGHGFLLPVGSDEVSPAPSGALFYQALIEQQLSEQTRGDRYPPVIRAAIMIGGGLAAWALVAVAARAVFGVFA